MAAGKHNIVWEQGTTIATGFTLREPAPEEAEPGELGEPIDLTGWTARMHVRSTLPNETVLHEFTTEDGGIELGADGSILILASATESAAWDWPILPKASKPVAVYDLELVNPIGDVKRFLEGKITLNLEVTRQ